MSHCHQVLCSRIWVVAQTPIRISMASSSESCAAIWVQSSATKAPPTRITRIFIPPVSGRGCGNVAHFHQTPQLNGPSERPGFGVEPRRFQG
jgi:hypothetical protein